MTIHFQEPYAYEFGRDNGDGTFSVVIERGSLVHVGAGPFWTYGPPKDPHPDWPVKPLYTLPLHWRDDQTHE